MQHTRLKSEVDVNVNTWRERLVCWLMLTHEVGWGRGYRESAVDVKLELAHLLEVFKR